MTLIERIRKINATEKVKRRAETLEKALIDRRC